MSKYLSIIFLLFCAACNKQQTYPTFSNLQVGEQVLLTDYIGHMLPPSKRSNIGMAYRFVRIENGFKIYKHDPYAENVRMAIQDSAKTEEDLVYPVDQVLKYYRNLPEYGGCDSITNFKAIWYLADSTFVEKYSDDTCQFGRKFEEHPLMPALRAAGFKPKL